MNSGHNGLPRTWWTAIMPVVVISASFALSLLNAPRAFAQESTESKGDELDVTMQIIVDPDAKLPDEVVRRIPLPARKAAPQPATTVDGEHTTPAAADKGQERADEAQELGRDMSERAKERAQDAADQREQARRSVADERRRNPNPPTEPPRSPPPRP